MTLDIWAQQWGILPEALADLRTKLHKHPPLLQGLQSAMSEAAVQQRIRMAAPKHRVRLYRNNNGMAMDKNGNPIRFGLGNDSTQANKIAASSDLIGITEHIVTPEDIGQMLGVFTSVEVKKHGWKYKGTPREQAQLNWIEHILLHGGRALFATCPEDVWPLEVTDG